VQPTSHGPDTSHPLRLQFARLRRRTLTGARSTARHRRADPRQLVKDQEAFRTFVDTIISGDIATLSTQSQRDLATVIRREIAYSGLRPISHVCRLMSELPKSEWRGINWNTLRDNYLRQPGTRRRSCQT
jgi:hypothetical protein